LFYRKQSKKDELTGGDRSVAGSKKYQHTFELEEIEARAPSPRGTI
jgi:hypothetical protein